MAKWVIDPDHSVAAFTVRHMMLANVRGQFNKISGTVDFDFESQAGFSLEATVDASGIYTGIRRRDEHLAGPDFFDVINFPVMTFRSTGFKPEGRNNGKLSGELMVHGIIQPLSLDMHIAGPVKSPEETGGETSLGITARSSVKREDFGMLWNVPLDGGGVMVGNGVEIYLDIEADLVE